MRIATANRLSDGAVVFLAARDWMRDIDAAFVARTPSEVRGLEAQMIQSEAARELVGAYLIEVELVDGHVEPKKFREKIRATGPTIRPDLAHQHHTNGARGDTHVSL